MGIKARQRLAVAVPTGHQHAHFKGIAIHAHRVSNFRNIFICEYSGPYMLELGNCSPDLVFEEF